MNFSAAEAQEVLRLVGVIFGGCNTSQKDFGTYVFQKMLNENPNTRKVFVKQNVSQDPKVMITYSELRENDQMKAHIKRLSNSTKEMFSLIADAEAFHKKGVQLGEIHARRGVKPSYVDSLRKVVLDVFCEEYNLTEGSPAYNAFVNVYNALNDSMQVGMQNVTTE